MADASGEGLSKSAKKRAAKKARDAAHQEAEAEPLPLPPAPKAKGKAKAAAAPPQPEPAAKAKAKAKAKAEPTPEPKAKAKGQPKAEPKAAPAPEPAPKAQGKQKAKAAKQPKQEEEPQVPKADKDELVNYVIDDGSGPAWEAASGLSKRQEKRKAKQDAQDAQPRGSNGKPVVQQHVVGMAPPTAKASGPKGPSQAVAADVQRILAMKGDTPVVEEKTEVANLSTVTVTVPEKRIGVIIGPKGANIKMLTEKTGVTRIDTSGTLFTISGEPKCVALAQTAIQELSDKGYCALMFDGFSENIVNVHPSSFPDLIGKEGCIVRKIKEGLKVEINFQDIGKGAPAGKKAKVTLAGSAENVEKAKNVINNIIMYGHDELTHPGFFHEELDIEPWQYRFIIGKGGSEMKHIQHNWKVKVNIPREHSANEKVLIVGERDQVERAKAYIEKVIWNAEDASKGRDRVDRAVDPWGEEEEVEPWMKPYMYKR